MEDESENSSLVSSLSSPFRSQLNLSDSETHDSSSLPDILRVVLENPHVPSTAFASISASTMADLLSSMPNDIFLKHYILIDCRYPFEYDGGHIRGARNLFDPVKIEDVFYPRNLNSREPLYLRRPIFYCEFSQKRGPTMAHDLRAFDRMRNFSRYPLVDYPEMYLLEFGYSTFYRTYAENKPVSSI
ncbi:unnamed protein product [Thelazia callipaeda]|uniref:protein-tyrosine-phosphatase n=1 Tax=Thelazia callipaeda TaxID=103827 RepID=A0A0N5CZN8_THECL|nr:unnamed protein product [Thelazia callipaeda]